MTDAAIPPAVLPRLAQLVRLIGSPVDGEALAACRALGRTLAGCGADFHALAQAVEHPAEVVVYREPEAPRKRREARPGDVMLDAGQRARVAAALRRAMSAGRLNTWERAFAGDVVERLQAGRGRLSERQGEVLECILRRIGERGL